MRRTVLVLLTLLFAFSGPAFAGGGAKGDWEIGPYVGYGWPDDYGTFQPKKHFLWGGRLGYFFSSAWDLEFSGQQMKTQTDFDSVGAVNVDAKLTAYRLNLLYNFAAGKSFRPFLTVGGGSEKVAVETYGESKDIGWNAGLGFRIFPSPGWDIRVDGRYVHVKPKDLIDVSQKNWEATLGLNLVLGKHHHEEKAVEVVHENVPPTVSLVCDHPDLGAGETMNASATAADVDGDALTYEWSATTGRVTGSGATATFTFADATPPGSSTITVKVSDGHGHTTSAECTVAMRAPPPAPEAVSCLAGGFPRNLSRLNNVDKACLDDVAQRLKTDPRAHVIVIGYADSHERTPDALSRQRAQAVSDYLVQGGIESGRVTVRAGAAGKPLDTGTDVAAQAKNRRAELWFVPEGAKDPD